MNRKSLSMQLWLLWPECVQQCGVAWSGWVVRSGVMRAQLAPIVDWSSFASLALAYCIFRTFSMGLRSGEFAAQWSLKRVATGSFATSPVGKWHPSAAPWSWSAWSALKVPGRWPHSPWTYKWATTNRWWHGIPSLGLSSKVLPWTHTELREQAASLAMSSCVLPSSGQGVNGRLLVGSLPQEELHWETIQRPLLVFWVN